MPGVVGKTRLLMTGSANNADIFMAHYPANELPVLRESLPSYPSNIWQIVIVLYPMMIPYHFALARVTSLYVFDMAWSA